MISVCLSIHLLVGPSVRRSINIWVNLVNVYIKVLELALQSGHTIFRGFLFCFWFFFYCWGHSVSKTYLFTLKFIRLIEDNQASFLYCWCHSHSAFVFSYGLLCLVIWKYACIFCILKWYAYGYIECFLCISEQSFVYRETVDADNRS